MVYPKFVKYILGGNKMKFKKLPALALAFGLASSTLLAPQSSFARDTDYTTGSDFSWSPYWYSLTDYISSSDATRPVGSFQMKLNDTAVNKTKNTGYHSTMEINNTSDNVPYSGWYATNMPNHKFDSDDDNSNGKSEELEVIYKYASGLTPYQNYYFQAAWDGYGGEYGKFDFIYQLSIWNGFNSEYEAYHYDYLGSSSWALGYGIASVADSGNEENVVVSNKDKNDFEQLKESDLVSVVRDKVDNDINVELKIKNKDDLKKYAELQKTLSKELKHQEVDTIITFSQPITESELKQIVNQYNLEISSFNLKATDQATGEWVTVRGVPENNKFINQSRIDSVTEGKKVVVEGFTSVEAKIGKFNQNKWLKLQDESNVFLADLMPEYSQVLADNQEAQVLLGDFAQELEMWK
jgi:hypothetical protein